MKLGGPGVTTERGLDARRKAAAMQENTARSIDAKRRRLLEQQKRAHRLGLADSEPVERQPTPLDKWAEQE